MPPPLETTFEGITPYAFLPILSPRAHSLSHPNMTSVPRTPETSSLDEVRAIHKEGKGQLITYAQTREDKELLHNIARVAIEKDDKNLKTEIASSHHLAQQTVQMLIDHSQSFHTLRALAQNEAAIDGTTPWGSQTLAHLMFTMRNTFHAPDLQGDDESLEEYLAKVAEGKRNEPRIDSFLGELVHRSDCPSSLIDDIKALLEEFNPMNRDCTFIALFDRGVLTEDEMDTLRPSFYDLCDHTTLTEGGDPVPNAVLAGAASPELHEDLMAILAQLRPTPIEDKRAVTSREFRIPAHRKADGELQNELRLVEVMNTLTRPCSHIDHAHEVSFYIEEVINIDFKDLGSEEEATILTNEARMLLDADRGNLLRRIIASPEARSVYKEEVIREGDGETTIMPTQSVGDPKRLTSNLSEPGFLDRERALKVLQVMAEFPEEHAADLGLTEEVKEAISTAIINEHARVIRGNRVPALIEVVDTEEDPEDIADATRGKLGILAQAGIMVGAYEPGKEDPTAAELWGRFGESIGLLKPAKR